MAELVRELERLEQAEGDIVVRLPGALSELLRERGARTARNVTVKMSAALVEALDRLVEMGCYESRSEAIRVAVAELLKRERRGEGCG